jgi:RNA polymerase sigma factor (sigma-70 family)
MSAGTRESRAPDRLGRRDCALQHGYRTFVIGAVSSNETEDLRKLRAYLLRRLLRRGVLRDDAEDAIQDAFVRLCLTRREQNVRNLAAFLTGVVKRIRIDLWRAAQRHQRRIVPEHIEELELTDPAPQPSDCVQAEQLLERIWRRLGELCPRSREVLFLHRFEGRTCREIAVSLGISISAVEKHIARAAFAIADENQSA